MGCANTNSKQQAHELIERMSAVQVSAVVGLLETMLDPVSVALANAPLDDEPVSEEEARDIAEAHSAIARGEITSNEEVLVEFGLTPETLSGLVDASCIRVARTPRRVTSSFFTS